MSGRRRGPHAALSALCLCGALATGLVGCSLYRSVFHGSRDRGCTEKPLRGDTRNLPGLKVPEGMRGPDPRSQVRVPALDETEPARAPGQPCLDAPPSYASGSSIAVPVHSGTPMGVAPAAPVPVSPVKPQPPEGNQGQ